MHRKHAKQHSAGQQHRALRDALRQHLSAEHREARAQRMPQRATQRDADRVLRGGQSDRGDLRPVAPLRQERQRERLREYGPHGLAHRRAQTTALKILVLDTELALRLLELLVRLVGAHGRPLAEQLDAEVGEQCHGGVVRVHLREDGGEGPPDQRRQHGHQRQRADRAREHGGAVVLHRQDGGDEESLVAQLRDDDHDHRVAEGGPPVHRGLLQVAHGVLERVAQRALEGLELGLVDASVAVAVHRRERGGAGGSRHALERGLVGHRTAASGCVRRNSTGDRAIGTIDLRRRRARQGQHDARAKSRRERG
mmetsp:Transcript_61443/g.148630  ORF Transcript_61443/g.148630 Transcript_61443/m.148630 type:complete len:311 (-) Transcript_61443:84-1016(-)